MYLPTSWIPDDNVPYSYEKALLGSFLARVGSDDRQPARAVALLQAPTYKTTRTLNLVDGWCGCGYEVGCELSLPSLTSIISHLISTYLPGRASRTEHSRSASARIHSTCVQSMPTPTSASTRTPAHPPRSHAMPVHGCPCPDPASNFITTPPSMQTTPTGEEDCGHPLVVVPPASSVSSCPTTNTRLWTPVAPDHRQHSTRRAKHRAVRQGWPPSLHAGWGTATR